jgi:hypothetical protein
MRPYNTREKLVAMMRCARIMRLHFFYFLYDFLRDCTRRETMYAIASTTWWGRRERDEDYVYFGEWRDDFLFVYDRYGRYYTYHPRPHI